VLLLAGGFGSRLRSVVSDVPKPLAPVCGKPFLLYLMENYIRQGAKEFVFLLHYEAKLIEALIEQMAISENFLNVKMICLYESKPLGTGGAIRNAIDVLNINEPFIVLNGDTWLTQGFEKLVSSKPNSLAAVKVADCTRYGSLVVKDNNIDAFLEKDGSIGEGLINAGLYHLKPEIFLNFTNGENFSLEQEVLPLIAKSGTLEMVKVNSEFIDIGIPDDYFRFCEWIRLEKTIEL